MTRKDYVLLAGAVMSALHNAKGPGELSGVIATAEKLAEHLARDNARFEKRRFLVACGVAK